MEIRDQNSPPAIRTSTLTHVFVPLSRVLALTLLAALQIGLGRVGAMSSSAGLIDRAYPGAEFDPEG